jgi:hypothetical protein
MVITISLGHNNINNIFSHTVFVFVFALIYLYFYECVMLLLSYYCFIVVNFQLYNLLNTVFFVWN